MHTDFVASRDNTGCSLSTWYKTFYITPLSEREKEPCLCIKCQNVHLLSQGINRYRSIQNLSKHFSVKKFLNSEPPINSNNFPECNDAKEISYYNFETRTVIYEKWKNPSTQIQLELTKKEKVCEIAKKLLNRGESYLRHQSDVDK